MNQRCKNGFTLVELSVVLVIISLIVAGILVGRDLIRSAEVRRQVSQLEGFETAANAFKSKYNCLPGDCSQAEQLGLGTSGGPGANGDGDGRIYNSDESVGTIVISKEMLNFWHHLAQANMAGGNFGGYYGGMSLFDTYPGKFTPPLVLPSLSLSTLLNWANRAGGVVVLHLQEMDIESFYGTFFNFSGLFEDPNKNFWYLTVTTEVFSPAGVWLPKDAYAVDVKIDDGLPRDGKMRSISGRFGTGMWDPSGTACVDKSVTPYQYNIQQIDISAATYTNILCAPFIMTSF